MGAYNNVIRRCLKNSVLVREDVHTQHAKNEKQKEQAKQDYLLMDGYLFLYQKLLVSLPPRIGEEVIANSLTTYIEKQSLTIYIEKQSSYKFKI